MPVRLGYLAIAILITTTCLLASQFAPCVSASTSGIERGAALRPPGGSALRPPSTPGIASYSCHGCSSGYGIENVPVGQLNSVTLTFKVPLTNCSTDGDLAFEVGLDIKKLYGFAATSSALYLNQQCSAGSLSDAMYWDDGIVRSGTLGLSPSPGDIISLTVADYQNHTHFFLDDITTGQHASARGAGRSFFGYGAYCSLDRPLLLNGTFSPLLDFGSTTFDCRTGLSPHSSQVGIAHNFSGSTLVRSTDLDAAGTSQVASVSKITAHRDFTISFLSAGP